jgi:hypothetical protein
METSDKIKTISKKKEKVKIPIIINYKFYLQKDLKNIT